MLTGVAVVFPSSKIDDKTILSIDESESVIYIRVEPKGNIYTKIRFISTADYDHDLPDWDPYLAQCQVDTVDPGVNIGRVMCDTSTDSQSNFDVTCNFQHGSGSSTSLNYLLLKCDITPDYDYPVTAAFKVEYTDLVNGNERVVTHHHTIFTQGTDVSFESISGSIPTERFKVVSYSTQTVILAFDGETISPEQRNIIPVLQGSAISTNHLDFNIGLDYTNSQFFQIVLYAGEPYSFSFEYNYRLIRPFDPVQILSFRWNIKENGIQTSSRWLSDLSPSPWDITPHYTNQLSDSIIKQVSFYDHVAPQQFMTNSNHVRDIRQKWAAANDHINMMNTTGTSRHAANISPHHLTQDNHNNKNQDNIANENDITFTPELATSWFDISFSFASMNVIPGDIVLLSFAKPILWDIECFAKSETHYPPLLSQGQHRSVVDDESTPRFLIEFPIMDRFFTERYEGSTISITFSCQIQVVSEIDKQSIPLISKMTTSTSSKELFDVHIGLYNKIYQPNPSMFSLPLHTDGMYHFLHAVPLPDYEFGRFITHSVYTQEPSDVGQGQQILSIIFSIPVSERDSGKRVILRQGLHHGNIDDRYDDNIQITHCFESKSIDAIGSYPYITSIGGRPQHSAENGPDNDQELHTLYTFELPTMTVDQSVVIIDCLIFTSLPFHGQPITTSILAEVYVDSDGGMEQNSFYHSTLLGNIIFPHANSRGLRSLQDSVSINGDGHFNPGDVIQYKLSWKTYPGLYILPSDVFLVKGTLFSLVESATCSITVPGELPTPSELPTHAGHSGDDDGDRGDYATSSSSSFHRISSQRTSSCHYSSLNGPYPYFNEHVREDYYLICYLLDETNMFRSIVPNVTKEFHPYVVHYKGDGNDSDHINISCSFQLKTVTDHDFTKSLYQLQFDPQISADYNPQDTTRLFYFKPWPSIHVGLTITTYMWLCQVIGSVVSDELLPCHPLPSCSTVTSCGEICTFHPKCYHTVGWQPTLADDDQLCIDAGLPSPNPSAITTSHCQHCPDDSFAFGPECDYFPELSRVIVDQINRLYIMNIPDIETYRRGDTNGYDILVYYGDVITITWSYAGPAGVTLSLFMFTKDGPFIRYNGRSNRILLESDVNATLLQYSFRLIDNPFVREYGRQIEHVEFIVQVNGVDHVRSDAPTIPMTRRYNPILHFDLSCNSRTNDYLDPLPQRLALPVSAALGSQQQQQQHHQQQQQQDGMLFGDMHIANTLQASIEDPDSPIHPQSGCENYGVCNPSIAKCACLPGYTGDRCQYWKGGSNPDDDHNGGSGGNDSWSARCNRLQCVREHTYAKGVSTNDDICVLQNPFDVTSMTCNCLPDYVGDQCQHERKCEKYDCYNGRLVSPSGKPEECVCECTNQYITGSSCQQCTLPCRNGGTVNRQCTQCQCTAGYIGDLCQIPVWYHSFTLRNLPQHIVEIILNTSTGSQREMALLQHTMVKTLLADYSKSLRTTFIIIDENGNGSDTNHDDKEEESDTSADDRIQVRVELSQLQIVIPPTNPNAPYVYIQLMLYPANMTDEMLEYAQKHGLNVDWSRVTNNLQVFKQFLIEQKMIDENEDGGSLLPEIEDPGCTTRGCHEAIIDDDDDPSSNHSPTFTGYGLIAYATTLSCILLYTFF